MRRMGITVLPDIVNALILTSSQSSFYLFVSLNADLVLQSSLLATPTSLVLLDRYTLWLFEAKLLRS